MSGLFISYRRQDSAAAAGRLRSELARRYGEARVVLDVVDIAPGANWSDELHETIAFCESMLVVIGPQWLSATDPGGRRRIDDPADFIRSEIATALRMNKRVVPVLVGGATMPSPGDLPPELMGLARRQAGLLRDTHWHDDLEQFFDVLDPLMGNGPAVSGARAPASRAMPSLMSRLAQAFQVLLGRADRETIVGALESRGRRCWFAHRDIPPGVPSWAEPIVTAIANSRLVVVMLTKHSMPSVEVLREVTVASHEKIPLLPVSLDGTPLSRGMQYFFVAGQRLDLSGAAPDERVRSILPAVDRNLPDSA